MTDTTQAAGLPKLPLGKSVYDRFGTLIEEHYTAGQMREYARAALAAQATVTDDMRNAVRWAPSSAHWSEKLRDFFGPDARSGIDALEKQLREALAAQAVPVPITDAEINKIAELTEKAMNDGLRGFCKTWGWQQFARTLIENLHPYGLRVAASPTPAEAKEEQKCCGICGDGKTTLVKQCDHCGSVYADAETFATPQPQAAQPVGEVFRARDGEWGFNPSKTAWGVPTKPLVSDASPYRFDVFAAAPALTEEQEYEAFKIWYSNRYRYDFDGPQSTWTHAAMCDAREIWRAALRSTQGGEP